MDFAPLFERIRSIPPSHSIFNLTGSSIALFLALRKNSYIMVESTEEKAEELYKDILFFKSILNISHLYGDIFFLPEPGSSNVSGKRAEIIYNLKKTDSIITSKDALLSDLWMPEQLQENVLLLKEHFEISRDILEQRLISLGYKSAAIVVEHGEFSRRGWLFDIFPSTASDPLRIEFFGDTIESIKTFDINTQRSLIRINEFTIFPASEPEHNGSNIFRTIGNSDIFYSDSTEGGADFPENAVFLSSLSFETADIGFRKKGIDAGFNSLSGYGLLHNERHSIYEFPTAIQGMLKNVRIIIVSSSHGQAERVKELLMSGSVIAPVIENEKVFQYDGNILITVGELSSGLLADDLLILTEKEIFGQKPAYRSIKKSKVSKLLTTIDDLALGDFIVHRDHGIGRFVGLEKRKIMGYEGDLIVLEYAGGDRLYLPLYSIERINKYHAEEGITPKMDRLGGKTWQTTKKRVKKKIKELAEKLIKLYAEREISKGFVFSPDTEMHREFDEFFLYEETPDQLKAIEEIKSDMESEKPMDRLLCGDVGYGKTEVAMRAAFKAVYDGKQVAVFVPTTLLCEQHYRTFTQRFSAFPVSIDYLSRFKSGRDQADTIKKAASGEIDILIGTHALLRKDIDFHNLGLLIIDEEHRFGVAQKEKIKWLKKGIDVLTLSATPIPRTLNMAMSGIRSMSLIETPPEERLAVKGIVSVFNDRLITDAIKKELERGGQTYFVHNRIQDMEKIVNHVKRLVPKARVSAAHGQMSEKELEKIMKRFIDKEIDVLVSTAIIGSGLDIPTANTIIIDRADKIGLADLYQFKGRVGRSNLKAYAFFLIPGEDIITDEAKKRLSAIQDMSYLGAGFRLAMKDLEIRGTGNLLGPQQSGHIHAVGFDMYIEMLQNAVAELRGVKVEEETDPRINLRILALIPEDYIDDISLRLSIYRRISSAKNGDELYSLFDEITDRFGRPPIEVKNLFDIMRLKIISRKLQIAEINESRGIIRIIFAKNTKVPPEKIIELRNISAMKIRFYPDGFELSSKGLSWDETYKALRDILEKLC